MTHQREPRRDKSAIEEFPVVIELPVLWGDQDLFGHVNNTVYFKWYESSRVAYWHESGLDDVMKPKNWGPILASASCDFLKQIKYPDMIIVSAHVAEIRRTSMLLDHAIYSKAEQAIAARGKSVVVLFDYSGQKPQRITPDLRTLISKAEGREV